jgi:hypothetical protein
MPAAPQPAGLMLVRVNEQPVAILATRTYLALLAARNTDDQQLIAGPSTEASLHFPPPFFAACSA